MLVMSKNITSRRRSWYFTSPGLEGAIWLAVSDFTDAARSARLRGRFASGFLIAGAGAAPESRSLPVPGYSKTVDLLLLAVFGDDEVAAGLRPSIGLPPLSLAVTSTTTSWRVVPNLVIPPLGRGGVGRSGVCCCGTAGPASRPIRRVAMMDRSYSF